MSSQPSGAHTFIIRVWREPGEGGRRADEWRGEAQHVPSGRRVYFREIAAVTDVLAALIRDAERD